MILLFFYSYPKSKSKEKSLLLNVMHISKKWETSERSKYMYKNSIMKYYAYEVQNEL